MKILCEVYEYLCESLWSKYLRKYTMATKWKCFCDAGRKFNKCWETKFIWVRKASDRTENAYCKLCRCTMQPKLSNLAKHEKSEKQTRRLTDQTSSRPLPVVRIATKEDEVKRAEIELALTISCHSAITMINHLGELITRNANGSKLEKIKLHKAKCSEIITKIIAPEIKKELIEGKKFSILVYECTDLSTKKFLSIVIRYYREKEKKIEAAFVDFVEVTEEGGEDLYVF